MVRKAPRRILRSFEEKFWEITTPLKKSGGGEMSVKLTFIILILYTFPAWVLAIAFAVAIWKGERP